MSDWRFASIGGYLTWFNSDDPDDEQYLYSELSPTLIVGHQEKGDVFPVDYIKLTGVGRAIQVSDTRIDLTKKDDADFIQSVVAPTKAEADEWYKMIVLALGEGGGSPASIPAEAPAQPAPFTEKVEPTRDVEPEPHKPSAAPMRVEPVAVPAVTRPTKLDSPLAATQPPKPEAPLQQQRQPIAAPLASSAAKPNAPRWDEPATRAPTQPVATVQQNYTTYDPLNAEIKTTTTTSYDDVRSGGMDPREKARQWMDEQKQGTSAVSKNNSNTFQSTGSAAAAAPGWYGGTSAANRQDQQLPQAAPRTPVTPSQLGGAGWGTTSGPKNTTGWNTTTVGNDSNAFSPRDMTSSKSGDQGMFDVQDPSVYLSPAGSGAWNSGNKGLVPTPRQPQATYAAGNRNSGNVPTPVQSGYYQPTANANSSGNMGGYADPASMNTSAGGAAGRPLSTGIPAPTPDLRKRSGMFVNVPPNPQMNRNVAPNLSAIWKEWTDPEGVLYVYHEPTQTMHRRVPGAVEFETLVEGLEDIPEDDLRRHPYFDEMGDTYCDVNGNVVRNVQNYGNQRVDGEIVAASPDLYRSDLVTSPRGQYSPSRRARVSAAVPAPREATGHYEGRRVHQLVLSTGADASESVITHQIQPLGVAGLMWDPQTGKTLDTRDSDGTNPRNIGPTTLQKQWEHVRHILIQGRYFKKHALKNNATSFRFCFLTGDNAYVVCVPTSEVMLNVHTDPQTFHSVQDSIQYYGPQSRAIPLNTVTRVTIGSEEEFVVRRKGINPASTFCIVSRTHAFILECNSPKEARYFADAWTFFLYHSKPLMPHKNRTPQMKRPITHGTRTGIAF